MSDERTPTQDELDNPLPMAAYRDERTPTAAYKHDPEFWKPCVEGRCPHTPTPAAGATPATEPQMMVPTRLLRTEWPPNDGLMPGDPQFDDLLTAIQRDGYIRVPLKIKADWSVIDGAHRLNVARLLGMEWVPVRVWTGIEWLPIVPADGLAIPADRLDRIARHIESIGFCPGDEFCTPSDPCPTHGRASVASEVGPDDVDEDGHPLPWHPKYRASVASDNKALHLKDDPPHDVDEFCDNCAVRYTETPEFRAALAASEGTDV